MIGGRSDLVSRDMALDVLHVRAVETPHRREKKGKRADNPHKPLRRTAQDRDGQQQSYGRAEQNDEPRTGAATHPHITIRSLGPGDGFLSGAAAVTPPLRRTKRPGPRGLSTARGRADGKIGFLAQATPAGQALEQPAPVVAERRVACFGL